MPVDRETTTFKTPDLSLSVSFWGVLLIALGLYGLAVLAPKLADREQLLSESHTQQLQLSRDEEKLTRLQQVSAALQQDSRFVEELVRSDGNSAPQDDEEIILLEGNLVYRENERGQDSSPARTNRNPAWYLPALKAVGHSSDIRGVLLLSSLVLILFAFGFLQSPDSAAGNAEQKPAGEVPRQPNLMKKWLARYGRPGETAERRKLFERLSGLEPDADWEKDALPIVSFDDDDT